MQETATKTLAGLGNITLGEGKMHNRQRIVKTIRWMLGVLLVVVGLSTTWAWGEVARMAEPAPAAEESPVTALYAAWQLDGSEQPTLFRSIDEWATRVTLVLPGGVAPRVWADDGDQRVAVAAGEGSVLLSDDRGDTWTVAAEGLPVTSLVWDEDGGLYVGTSGEGIYRLATDGTLLDLAMTNGELATADIVEMSLAGGHLFAATPSVLFHTSGRGATWTKTTPLPERVTAVAATDPRTVYAGTATVGVYKSSDAGQTWQPAREGLGLAAGQMVKVTALRADPSETGVLYAAVDHAVGSTHVHASAAGVFVTVDNGASWQPLAGPSFPEARHASSLVLIAGKPLNARAVTAEGLQGYAPDVMRLLAALESDDPRMRASAGRQLGMARPLGVWNELLAALDDPDPAVRLVAADALGRISEPAAVPGLLIAVKHPSEQVRLGAARALGMMKVEAAVEPLRAMLLQGEGLEVSVAGEALGGIGGSKATDALLTALADPQPTARWHVAMAALEGMGEPAVEPLIAMLDSRDAHARRNAAQALGWIGSPSATNALVRALEKDRDATVRGQAAWALGEVGDAAARRTLERAQLRDPAIEVQTAAERALSLVPARSETDTGWSTRWAPALNQLQPVRWLVLGLSLIGGAWLMMGAGSLAAVPLLRHRHR
jgi:HEAT repeat protein